MRVARGGLANFEAHTRRQNTGSTPRLSSAQLGRIISRMKTISCVLPVLLTASAAFSQQVGVVDLTRPIGVLAPAEQSANQVSSGCAQEKIGILSNGVMKPDDNQSRSISLEIIKLRNETLEVGGDGRAEVRLKNTSEKPISIPSSTDWSAIRKASDPDHLEWEEGSFQVVLRDKQNHDIALRSTDWSLYGSQLVSGSLLTVKPGEWITALLNFKVENRYRAGNLAEFPAGEAKLFLEWEQELRMRNRENCAWNRSTIDYKGYYKQEHPTVIVQVNKSGSGKNKNSE